MLYKAFTLIELTTVLVIIGIMLMATIYLSGEQVQKVKNKTVKESIIAEMQSRYSRNLWSSSYAWKMYDTMNVTFGKWDDKIRFQYTKDWNPVLEDKFSDKFEIKYITTGWWATPVEVSNVKLRYSPYNISCKIWEDSENISNVVIIARVNDNRNYCFEIPQKNCRLVEMSEDKCNTFVILAGKK